MHLEKLYEPLFMAFIFTRLLWTKNQIEVSIVIIRFSLCIITRLFLILRGAAAGMHFGSNQKHWSQESLRHSAFLVKKKKKKNCRKHKVIFILPLFHQELLFSLSLEHLFLTGIALPLVQWGCSSLPCGTRLPWMTSPPSRGNGLRWPLWQKSSCTQKSRRSSCPGCPAAQPPMQVGTVPLAAVSEDGARQLHS